MSTSVLWLGMWLAGCSRMFSGARCRSVAVTPSAKAGKAKSAPKAQPTPSSRSRRAFRPRPTCSGSLTRSAPTASVRHDDFTTPKLAAWARRHRRLRSRRVSGRVDLPSMRACSRPCPCVAMASRRTTSGSTTVCSRRPRRSPMRYDTYAFVANPHVSRHQHPVGLREEEASLEPQVATPGIAPPQQAHRRRRLHGGVADSAVAAARRQQVPLQGVGPWPQSAVEVGGRPCRARPSVLCVLNYMGSPPADSAPAGP